MKSSDLSNDIRRALSWSQLQKYRALPRRTRRALLQLHLERGALLPDVLRGDLDALEASRPTRPRK
jgi:hypothetical protein